MGLHDIETMQEVLKELSAIDPTIIIIGEGWNMGTHPIEIRSNQSNIQKLDGIAVFNDQIRDGLKDLYSQHQIRALRRVLLERRTM